jgi:hypothetical protein
MREAPEEHHYVGCPLCHEMSESTWVTDPNSKLKCQNCGVYFDFAQRHFRALFPALEPREPDPETESISEREMEALMEMLGN